MSSTLRNKERKVSPDYYSTPIIDIVNVLDNAPSEFCLGNSSELPDKNLKILDPCAGGDENRQMSYPKAIIVSLAKRHCDQNLVNIFNYDPDIDTIDIRLDSRASTIGNYLELDCKDQYDLIITNPPFNIALDIIKKALNDVKENGWVCMLLRLNFFGSQSRKEFWKTNMPKYCLIHSKRMSFHDNIGTDSIEYMHCFWKKGEYPEYCFTKVI